MQNIITAVDHYGPLIVFLNALISSAGLPLPILPTLLTAAALAGQNRYQLTEIVLAGVGGALIADLVQYWCGLRYGQRFLGLLCKVSVSPDFCVRRTEEVFSKVGPWSLLFAKFLPGLSLISVAMSGVTKVSLLAFVVLDGIGALLIVTASVSLGLIFRDAITDVLHTLADFGKYGVMVVVAAVGLYMLMRWWRRRLFIRQLRMDRITIAELRKLIDEGEHLIILDVRPKEVRAQAGIIPGAIGAHPAEFDAVVMSYPRGLEIVVYCACPNEESAATAARHLRQAGFKKIRPLLGGIDAWVAAGHPVERASHDEEAQELVHA